jgi:hypothetical protein
MKTLKCFLAISVDVIFSSIAIANEWSDIDSIIGRYSRIYFDFVVAGNTGTFYCINDWMVNQDDGGAEGGVAFQ